MEEPILDEEFLVRRLIESQHALEIEVMAILSGLESGSGTTIGNLAEVTRSTALSLTGLIEGLRRRGLVIVNPNFQPMLIALARHPIWEELDAEDDTRPDRCRCKATTAAGRQCRNYERAMGAGYCKVHAR